MSSALCVQLAWAKRSGWLEAVISGPGRPVTGVGRTRGRLPANWAQRMALQQAQAPADSVKIPKKRGPKPGSKVALFLKTDTVDSGWMRSYHLMSCHVTCTFKAFVVSSFLNALMVIIYVFIGRENHVWYQIQSPHLPPPVPQSLTPALCLWTTPPSPSLHYRLPQVRSIHIPGLYTHYNY